MRQVAISRLGGPEVLSVRESPDPEPGPGEVRIRVKAAGVNFADILMRMGLYPGAPKPPFVPGYEAAGQVDKVGPDVLAWRPGDRVVVPINLGGYSDAVVAKAAEVFRIPEQASFEAAAALTVNYLTAYMALVEQGNLRPGRRVLIHGAAGGVGLAAIQIAKLFDAEIIGTASAGKHSELRKHGVAHAVDYRTQDFEKEVKKLTEGKGVHVVLDPVGGSSFSKSYRCLAPGGKLVMYGFSAAATGATRRWLSLAWEYFRTPRFSPFDLMMTNKGVVGIHLGRMTEEKELLRAAMQELVSWWAAGRISPVVGASFPMDMAHRAHEYIQSRQNIGKVVLTSS